MEVRDGSFDARYYGGYLKAVAQHGNLLIAQT